METKWLTECSHQLQCHALEPLLWASVSALSKGCYCPPAFLVRKDVTISFHRVGLNFAIYNYEGKRVLLHFCIFNDELEKRFLILSSEGLLKNKGSPQILISADIFSLVYAYSISGRMPIKLVILVEWRRRSVRGGGEGGRSRKQRADGGEKKGRDTVLYHLPIKFLTNSENLVSSLHLPS